MSAGFIFDRTACIGCMSCVAACMDAHDLTVGQHLRRVHTTETGSWGVVDGVPVPQGVGSASVSLSCHHCEKPACVDACPRRAMTKNVDTGVVYVDPSRCIGCGKCRRACPFDIPQILPRAEVPASMSGGQVQPDGKPLPKHVAIKCDFCRTLPEGPACVAACLMRCLHAK
jgi:anaerobic dimethyl sulfoxide reductase subunit B (iron-sulfur subunit)